MGRASAGLLLAKEGEGKERRRVEQLSWFLSCLCAGALLLLVANGRGLWRGVREGGREGHMSM